MNVETIVFDPAACAFPKPRVPLLPVGLRCLSPFPRPYSDDPTTGRWTSFRRGRYALREAFRRAGVGAGGAVLVPSYHCRTMVDPALELGGDAHLYALNDDLSPDMRSVETLLSESPRPVVAILATHFFGFPQSFGALAELCEKHGLALIEDCSHALVLPGHHPSAIGHLGRYVVSSPYKFIPCLDGGLLHDRGGGGAGPALRAPGWRDELRAFAHLFAPPTGGDHPGPWSSKDDDDLAAIAASAIQPGNRVQVLAGFSGDYHPDEADRQCSRVSLFLQSLADPACIADHRRRRYQQWLVAVSAMPQCRPLYPSLPPSVVPYMFPLLIDQVAPHFYWLKRLGVPVWRWDSAVVSPCPTADGYRSRLLHLPCHQAIDDEAMHWMTSALRATWDRARSDR